MEFSKEELALIKENLKFLGNLQEELKTQDDDFQASPRFWSVGDYKWTLARDGEGDRTVIYIPSHAEVYDLAEFRQEFNIEDWEGLSEKAKEAYAKIEDDDDFYNWYEKYIDCGVDTWDEKEEHTVRQDTFFLTKRECQEHIRRNKHNYRKPHTYAMTALRSPQFEKLMNILETMDWDTLLEKVEKVNE